MNLHNKLHGKAQKSFARRIGKSLSQKSINAIETILPDYKLDISNIKSLDKELILEIGFGMGEHLLNLCQHNPDKLYIGAEVYLNGVANFLNKTKALNISNYLIWADDIDIILNELSDNILSDIYVLFPDPWPKRKQNNKRLINETRLQIIAKKLRNGGNFYFASDIEDYFQKVLITIQKMEYFDIDNDFGIAHENYIETKYHNKAIREGRVPQFIKATLNVKKDNFYSIDLNK